MPDRIASIWTRWGGDPRKLGTLIRADDHVRFTYDAQAGDLPGLSLAHPVGALIRSGQTLEWRSDILQPLPPMLQALVPPRHEANLQRRILKKILADRGKPASGPEAEWEMLLLSGRGGIGHLDIFADDTEARNHYAGRRAPAATPTIDDPMWRLVKDAIDGGGPGQAERGIEELAALVGPRPTALGMMPKMLMRIRPPGRNEAVDAVVKFETGDYAGVLALEALCHDIHKEAGFDTPRIWLTEAGTLRLLIVERMDRTSQGTPLPFETVFSILHAASAGKIDLPTTDAQTGLPSFETVANMLVASRLSAFRDPRGDAERIYRRIVMALLTGNGDLHLENLAFLGTRPDTRLSPVYDPAPMRAFPQHDMVSAIRFGDMRTDTSALVGDFGDRVLALAGAFNLRRDSARKAIRESLDATETYLSRVDALDIPDGRKRQLEGAVGGIRHRLERIAGHS